eukprot:TRINITY_DN2168_c0_g3_i1.p1 TRINITY_DN2168_c0_g3~~TRINITY_DN2168_c0_g3_i1.p1  ORF type:complete len:388 (-),score=53.24 TRINITY_DN2168_c0_g3_i1:263-1426(-)
MGDDRRNRLNDLLALHAERFTSIQRELLGRDAVRASLAANDIYSQEIINSFTYEELKGLGDPITPGVAKALKAAFTGAAQARVGAGSGAGGAAAAGVASLRLRLPEVSNDKRQLAEGRAGSPCDPPVNPKRRRLTTPPAKSACSGGNTGQKCDDGIRPGAAPSSSNQQPTRVQTPRGHTARITEQDHASDAGAGTATAGAAGNHQGEQDTSPSPGTKRPAAAPAAALWGPGGAPEVRCQGGQRTHWEPLEWHALSLLDNRPWAHKAFRFRWLGRSKEAMRSAVKKLKRHKTTSAQPAGAEADAVRELQALLPADAVLDAGLALIEPFGISGIGLAFDMLSHDGVRELIRKRIVRDHLWRTAEMQKARGVVRNALAAYDSQAALSARV